MYGPPRTRNIFGSDGLEPQAVNLFDRLVRTDSGLGRLFRRATQSLLVLDDVLCGRHIVNRHHAGTRIVDVHAIHGTLNRDGDFDADFRPTATHNRSRWARVASAMMTGIELPPIELVQVGEDYFVKDGHHRISAARALKFAYLDAVVEVVEVA